MDTIRKIRVQQAAEILSSNHRQGYTIPSGRLYPFQWNWDAGFIALGWWHLEPEQAMTEIRRMFEGQWKHGMLPHINFFQPNDNYFPGPSVWKTGGSKEAPDGVATSGITQPPVFGWVLANLHHKQHTHDTVWMDFVREIYPKVVASHRYLYTHRDPFQEGLVYIQHNWESGTDNSPIWDDILDAMDVSQARDVSALRKDNKNVDPAERPTDENYKRYICLVDLFAELQYDDAAVAKQSPFLVQDVLFNALLVKSNEGLLELGRWLGEDVSDIERWNERTKHAIQTKLWDAEAGFYFAYDLVHQRSIRIKTSSGFVPLFAGICSKEQADQLVEKLLNDFAPSSAWMLCASTAPNEAAFNPLKYWRGPAWINLNWMLYHGLLHYGKVDIAQVVKQQTIHLVEDHGFYEYFDPRPSESCQQPRGIGADRFSWTAALYLDLVHETPAI